jgi:peptide/nickel transport system substrate-binding protein
VRTKLWPSDAGGTNVEDQGGFSSCVIEEDGISRRRLLQVAAGASGVVMAGGAITACGGSTVTTSTSGTGAATSSVAVQSVTNKQVAPATAPAKTGGTLRLGVTGGGSKDLVDGQTSVSNPDDARLVAGWEGLLRYDENFRLQPNLATAVTQSAPDEYIIVLREGVEFHNGKTLTPEDVIYSLQRIVDPKLGIQGAAGLASLDPRGITKVDAKTVKLKLKKPDSTIPDQLGQYSNTIVPVGYDASGPRIGTGAFKLKSFKAGEQSVHTKFANYWRPGEPSLDQITITDFADPAAQVNALLAGQIDAMTGVPFAQISVIKEHGGLSILESQAGTWIPLCMRVDVAPFDDVRVRQAFRLIVDRQAMVDQVLSGHGRVGNDLYGVFDPGYDAALPQRTQNIAEAKRLLAAAGKSNLSVDLHTTDGVAGMVDVAKVFAQQAKAAGVNVNVRVDANYYGDQYLKLAFSIDNWLTRSYLPQASSGSLPGSPFNETHWPPRGSNFQALYQQALASDNETARFAIMKQMQKLEYDEGGYIIPFFNNIVDAYSSKIQGFQPSKRGLPLDSYGNGFRTISFSS